MQRNARIITLVLTLSFIFHSESTVAQNAAEAKRNGERAYSLGHWRDAQMFLAQYQEAKPGDFEVLTKLGIALYQLRNAEEARRYLEYVAAKSPDSKDTELFYYLARTRHGLGEWDKAIQAYKSFLRVAPPTHPLRASTADNIRRCLSGMTMKPKKMPMKACFPR